MTTRIIRWKSVGGVGLEHVELTNNPQEIIARSVVIGTFNGHRHGTHYELTLSPDWEFRALVLEQSDGRHSTLTRRAELWFADGRPLPSLAGCVDVDLSGSPLTNTLPIRRLKWTMGQRRSLRMAFLPFDTLQLFADGQIYTCLTATSFRYQAEDGSFERTIAVDEDGLVMNYPGLFERSVER